MPKADDSQYRLQLRLYGEPDTVPNDQALIETLVCRHLNRLHSVNNSCVKAWVQEALALKFRVDNGFIAVAGVNASLEAAKPAKKEIEQAIGNEELPETSSSKWFSSDTANDSLVIM